MKIEPIPPFVSGKKLEKLLDVNEHFIEGLRKTGEWQEGVHYVFINPEKPRAGIRYTTALCLNWLATRADPEKHEIVKQEYLNFLADGGMGRCLHGFLCPLKAEK